MNVGYFALLLAVIFGAFYIGTHQNNAAAATPPTPQGQRSGFTDYGHDLTSAVYTDALGHKALCFTRHFYGDDMAHQYSISCYPVTDKE